MTSLNPRQEEIKAQFLDIGGERPTFDSDIGRDLQGYIEAEIRDDVPDDPEHHRLDIRKSSLEMVHNCEKRWYGDVWHGWSLPMLRGTISHRAIHRLVMGEYKDDPMTLVVDALERMTADDEGGELAQFLGGLTGEERHDLVAWGTNDTTTFMADWPRIPRAWTPRMEERRAYKGLCGGAVVVRAKYDLMLGTPNGMQARALIADLKSGKAHESHAAEARFYALVETLRQGVPPYRVGSYYLETGSFNFDNVTEDLLYQAAARLADGIRKMWQVQSLDREADVRASGLCTYCHLHLGCETGLAFIEELQSA